MRYVQCRLSQLVSIVMTVSFLCISCSAEYFCVITELLEKKTESRPSQNYLTACLL